MDHSRAVFLSDMGQCTPAAALSSGHRKYHWQTVPYEAEGVCGTLLFAGPETEAPQVTLPVEAAGWHAIYVGLWSNWTDSILKAKLTDDSAYVMMRREEETETSEDPVHSGPSAGRVNNYAVDERFWKFADLTGQDIQFAQHNGGMSEPAYVAYVKLVPLAEAEAEQVQADRANAENKRLLFMHDGFGVLQYRLTSREEIWEHLEAMRDTDFGTLLWCVGAGGDVLNYPSKYGKMIGDGVTDFPRTGDRDIHEALQIMSGKGIDTLQEVVEYCHGMGVKVHASNRMEAFQCNAPFEHYFTGDLYEDHPEWRCIDIDGREIARMSYAYQGVRDLVTNIFKEVASNYDIDGINLIFNRGAPFLLYEEPLIEGFRTETGLDARELSERDERYLEYRAGVMTRFMQDLRQEMDAIGRSRGRQVEVSAHVLNDEETNIYYALDVPTWVDEGLVDMLIAYPWRDAEIDVAYFGRLTAGTPVSFCPEVMPRRMSPEEYRRRAISNYADGADGLCFWDTYNRNAYRKEYSMVRRLGHKDELAGWDDGAGDYYLSRKLLSVGGYVLDKYPPHWAY